MSRSTSLCCRVLILALGALGATSCDESGPPAAPPRDEGAGDEVAIEEGALLAFGGRCREDTDCRRGMVCDVRSCGDDVGVCVAVPDDCGFRDRPQCGCDGVTYRNRCERIHAGAGLAHRGACREVCGGILGLTCDDDEVCRFDEGTCGDGDQQGLCVDRPDACPDIWEPVCGCDGATHANRCDALAAGVSVRHAGACEVACRSNRECRAEQFCAAERCGGEGVCETRPAGCPDVWEPVCGCDGRTYGNRCEASMAGVSVAARGECDSDKCGGTTGNRCDEGEFCDHDTCGFTTVSDLQGIAVFEPEGECVDIPEACPDVWLPVCGCDGKTYGNDCERQAAAVSKAHDGPCDDPRCFDDAACADGDYCAQATCGGEGRCTPRPEVCPDVRAPVCGCDGVTYGNRCEAAAAGASVQYEGECSRACGGSSGRVCDEGEVCDPWPGTCGGPVLVTALVAWPPAGQCVDVPAACDDVRQPVCGCDGETYANDCLRLQAGVAKLHEGACEVDGCERNGDCRDAEYCAKAGCDGVGTCKERPQLCPDVWLPVCGCDGRTYGNRCDAAAAGVNVSYEGECVARCGGIAGVACERGETCDPPAGLCDVADVQGTCVPQSEVCTEQYDPVCGCDGVTYSNDCFRIGAGVAKDHDGRCACTPIACDMWCANGYVLDENGCETCRCNEPPIEACCDPNEEPGTGDNPTCFEGATCCSDGAWRCNDAGGQSTCSAWDATAFRPMPSGDGRVCKACCDPAEAPGAGDNPLCFEGATCCADGAWHCNGATGEPTCEVLGQVCECAPVACLIACEHGFAQDDNGCETCRCAPAPSDDGAADPASACCDASRQSCAAGDRACP